MSGRMSRNKGKRGEREICDWLNALTLRCFKILDKEHLYPTDPKDFFFQRNQQQSAVGGDDIAHPFPWSIEVKFAETFQIDKWWEQTLASTARRSPIHGVQPVPLLMYRKSRAKWSVVTNAELEIPGINTINLKPVRVTLNTDSFEEYFIIWMTKYLQDFCHDSIMS